MDRKTEMQTSDLTSRMLAYQHLRDFNMDEAVDWATEMLMLDYESSSLAILAGLTKPTNFFEAETYLLASLNELNITLPEKHESIVGYCRTYIEKLAKSVDVKSNLEGLYSIGQSFDYEEPIFDFFLLYWAWEDLDYRDTYTHYVQDVTKDNIETVVIRKAVEWLKMN